MVIINGKYFEEGVTPFLTFDDGFSFGKGVFETILIKGSNPILLEKHVERINFAAANLKIKNSITEDYLLNIIKEFNIENCVLKLILSDRNIVITTRDNPYKSNDYSEGFSLTISDVRRNETSMLTYFKWTGYVENILEKQKASDLEYNDTIFLNSKGYLSETSVSNLFFVKDKSIYTPSIRSGILNGTVRDWVISNFEVIEGEYTLDNLLDADEVFITNSVMGVMKVRSINTTNFSAGIITSYISKKYFDFLEKY